MVVFGPGMPPERRGSWAIDVCIALGAAHAALFAVVAIARLTYPFDLEWMEGGELMAAVRNPAGQVALRKSERRFPRLSFIRRSTRPSLHVWRTSPGE